jgi:hypothetical protein
VYRNSFQNKKLPDSNEKQSLKDKPQSAGKRSELFLLKKVQNVENMVKKGNEIFRSWGNRRGKVATCLRLSQ